MQLERIYAHPCDPQTGKLTPPAEPKAAGSRPMTLEEELAAAEAFMRSVGVAEDQIPAGLGLIRRRRGEEG